MTIRVLKKKDLVGIHELDSEEVHSILELAADLKERLANGVKHRTCKGKVLAMIFQKPSTRTRISFEVGMYQLGGSAMYLSGGDLQLGRGETVADTARVLSRYADAIMARVFAHDDILTLAKYATVPVINGLSDLLHPCQALADLLTIKEKKGALEGVKLAYVGDGNNVAHSLLYAGAAVGMHVAVATPKGYGPDAGVFKTARMDAEDTGAVLTVHHDPGEAMKDADVVYTDVWASMGQEAEHKKRMKIFAPFQVNAEFLSLAKNDAIVMHCLPAHRGEEITDEVVDSGASVVFDQAENRLHAQKAVLTLLVGSVK
jgi:ornithine carbamoyltransferase